MRNHVELLIICKTAKNTHSPIVVTIRLLLLDEPNLIAMSVFKFSIKIKSLNKINESDRDEKHLLQVAMSIFF